VFRYKAPAQLKGNRITKIYKSDKNCFGADTIYCNDIVHTNPNYEIGNKTISVNYVNGVKFLQVNKAFLSGCNCGKCKKALIHSMDDFGCDYCTDRGCVQKETCFTCVPVIKISGCGCNNPVTTPVTPCNECENPPVWNTTGIAGGLKIDCKTYLTGNGSTYFNLAQCIDGAGIGSVKVSNLCSHSLREFLCGSLVLSANICGAKNIRSLTIKFGSSDLDYHAVTTTNFSEGWQFLQFDLDTRETVGFPNLDEISFYEFEVQTNGLQGSEIRMDSLFLSNQCPYSIEYYRNTFVQDADSGEYKRNYTKDTDIINLESDTFNIYVYEIMRLVSQSVQGGDSGADVKYYTEKISELYSMYDVAHKTEFLPTIYFYA
jgi:hypothetical protein